MVGFIFGLAALGWVSGDIMKDVVAPWVPALWEGFRFQGKHLEAAVALLAGAACLVTRQVNWAELKREPEGATSGTEVVMSDCWLVMFIAR